MVSVQQHSNPVTSSRGWFVWSLAAISFGYAFFHRVAPSVMVSELMGEFAIGGAMLGTLSALYFYPYVLLQIPLGALLEQFGTRFLLSGALVVTAFGTFLFGAAEVIEFAYIGRVLIGIGSSVAFLGALALAATWFPASRAAFLAGLAMFFAMSCGTVAQAPLALLVDSIGWRACISVLGFVGVGLALTVLVFVRNSPHISKSKETKAESWKIVWRDVGSAIILPDVWKIAIVAATLSGPMLALGGLWGTPFVMESYGLARPDAAFMMSFILLGWAVGAPASGLISDRLGKRKVVLVLASTGVIFGLMVLIVMPQLPIWILACVIGLIGLSGGGMSATYALAREIMPAHLGGTATGIVNSMTVASGAILQPLVGFLLDIIWDGKLKAGVRIYDAEDYRLAFLSILGSAVIGFIAAIRISEVPLDERQPQGAHSISARFKD